MSSPDDDLLKSALQNLRADRPDLSQPQVTNPVTNPPAPTKRKMGRPPIPDRTPVAPPIYMYSIEEGKKDTNNLQPIDNKSDLTEREIDFIRLTTLDGIPPLTAMITAGYPQYTDAYAYYLARQIVKKYERCTEGREIFSDLRFGPIEIAQGIIEIARHAPNLQVRLNALALAAKASGLLKEAVDTAPGVTITIKGRDQDDQSVIGGRDAPEYAPNAPGVQVQVLGPIAITR